MKSSELEVIFGKQIDSNEVNLFLEKYDSFHISRPSDGQQYVISNLLGVDLLFEPDEGMRGGRTKHLRKCQTIFLYSSNYDKHKKYGGDIPLGFTLDDSRSQLISKLLPTRTWKIGEGEVDVNCVNPDHDHWEFDNYHLSAHYDDSLNVMYFIWSLKNA